MSTELIPAPIPESGLAPMRPPAVDLVDAWLKGKKPTTQRGYANDLRDFARFLSLEHCETGLVIDWYLGQDAGTANALLLNYRNHQAEDLKLASATISRRMAAVRSIVKLARQLGRVDWSVEIASPKPEARRDMKGPDPEDIKRIKKALRAAPKRDQAIFALLYGLGLRRASVVGLDLADVDFAGLKLHVTLKGRREKKTKEMAPPVARAVGDWVLIRGNHPGPLFHRTDGARARNRLNLGSVNRILDGIGKDAGLTGKLRPHGLRHSAITELFRRKKTIAEVMSFSDHENPKTVMRYHDALKDSAGEMAREIAKTMD